MVMRAKNLVNHELTATLDRPPGKEKVGEAAQVNESDVIIIIRGAANLASFIVLFFSAACDNDGVPAHFVRALLFWVREEARAAWTRD